MKNIYCSLFLYQISLDFWSIPLKAEPVHGVKLQVVKPGVHPYIVLIARKIVNDEAERHACTGTLVRKDYVLTIASCFKDEPLDNLEAIFGSIDPRNPHHKSSDFSSRITFEEWSKTHPLSVYQSIDDVGLLKLNPDDDRDIYPGHLSFEPDDKHDLSKVRLIGWGHLHDHVRPKVPRVVTLKKLTSKECEKRLNLWAPLDVQFVLTKKLFCAAVNPTTVGTTGDYGGPILDKGDKIVGMLIKACSHPGPCNIFPGIPNVVLRLPSFSDFINDVVFK